MQAKYMYNPLQTTGSSTGK